MDNLQKFNTIEEAVEDLRQGKVIVVVDDPDRENEGDVVCAARYATAENVNFMASYARGLICMPMSRELTKKLALSQMVTNNTDNHCTAFTVSIDHVSTGTGISAAERSVTAVKCTCPDARPEDFRRPGHMFPLEARPGGVLERKGHTEATVDLMKIAGLGECGLCCEIMNDDGTMMRFRMLGYVNRINGEHHVALVKGDVSSDGPVLCRIHSECLTGDVFGSMRCDCGEQLAEALRRIEKAGRGVLVYLRQEGRGIGLINKLKAYELQEKGMDTVEANIALGFPADLREYDTGGAILADLGVRKLVLMTNNPLKIEGLPIEMTCNEKNRMYMYTKYKKMGHMLHFSPDDTGF